MTDVVDSSLRLLQALNDRDSKSVNESMRCKDVKTWVDNKVAVKRIRNARVTFRDDIEYITCLKYACDYNDARTVRQLVVAGADVTVQDWNGYTPLHSACLSKIDATKKVEFLLQRDAKFIATRDKFNNTPLHSASLAGNDDVISVLIQHGAQVNERGQFNRTPLHNACYKGHVSCIHVLLKHGADMEVRDSAYGETLIHLVAKFNHIDCLKTLVENYGSSINRKNKFNATPLHGAAEAGHITIVKQLTSYPGCDVYAKDLLGKTAADWAQEKGHHDIVRLLKSLPKTVSTSIMTSQQEQFNVAPPTMSPLKTGGKSTATGARETQRPDDHSSAVDRVTSAMASSKIRTQGYRVLTEKTLLKIASCITDEHQLFLGIHLDIPHAEIKLLNKNHPQFIEATLSILLTWRERTGNKSEKEQVDMLEEALKESKRNDLLHHIGR